MRERHARTARAARGRDLPACLDPLRPHCIECAMALTIEWRKRIDNWRAELPAHFYRPLGVVRSGVWPTADRSAHCTLGGWRYPGSMIP